MTLQELQLELLHCQSTTECDEFLQAKLHEIRPLFYGLRKEELCENDHYLDYEDILVAFDNSALGKTIRSESQPPPSVIALLILFLSLFKRSDQYASVRIVINLLPAGSLRDRCEAIFKYKRIENSRNDYISRFDSILGLLQKAWNESDEMARTQCEDLLMEYAIDAMLEPLAASIDIRQTVAEKFQDKLLQQRYPILRNLSVQSIFDFFEDALKHERIALKSRLIESLHAEACSLVPNSLLVKFADEFVGKAISATQTYTKLPDFLDDQLTQMDAAYVPKRQDARVNFNADAYDNRIYLGTYFPKTIIESWNIFSELFSIPIIEAAFRQKSSIRILDIGSGTGAAIVGMLLALKSWGQCMVTVEITSLDTNEDAISKQRIILESIKKELPFDFQINFCHQRLSFDLDGFVNDFSGFAKQKCRKYDVITCWKCLSEFYNVNYASAQGIIRNTLDIASSMIVPYGVCVVSDVTTTDNGYEYFAKTLNREVNQNDVSQNAKMRTIIPLPCATKSTPCQSQSCYTQRRFHVAHQLANHETKIAYRVLAPKSFADSITTTFTKKTAYQVNAASPNQACIDGRQRQLPDESPCGCGYTSFFHQE